MSDSIATAAVETAWRHWGALGVSSVAPLPETAVDLEALILLTAALEDRDPRLFDESSDWCARFGKFIASGRLRTLVRKVGDDFERSPLLRSCLKPADSAVPGRARERKRQTKAVLQHLDTPQRSLLRLRCVFGTTARAEILLSMLTQWNLDQYVTASALTELGYGKSAIATTLDELTLAGFMLRRTSGNTHQYRLRRGPQLKALLEPLPSHQSEAHASFPLIAEAIRLERKLAPKQRIVQSIEAKKFVDSHARDLARLDVATAFASPPDMYWDYLQRSLVSLLDDREGQ